MREFYKTSLCYTGVVISFLVLINSQETLLKTLERILIIHNRRNLLVCNDSVLERFIFKETNLRAFHSELLHVTLNNPSS